jgi:hypothetical protein
MSFNFPNTPSDGALFTPSVGGPTYSWSASTGAWMKVSGGLSAGVYIGDNPPANPVTGQLWWQSSSGNTFIYYSDPNSSQWVQFNTGPATGFSTMAVTIFTSSGTYTKPVNLKFLQVEVLGGGGAGGGAQATAASQFSVGAGGGGGGWGHLTIPAASVPASVSYTVGAGGTGVSGAAGNTGGTTTFSTLSAAGGAGGASGNPSGFCSAGNSGGGLVSGGEHTARGASSGSGYGVFGASMLWGGKGADSPFGQGGGGGLAGPSAGGAAFGFGAGGGGASQTASGAAQIGGAGAPGFIKITEYT